MPELLEEFVEIVFTEEVKQELRNQVEAKYKDDLAGYEEEDTFSRNMCKAEYKSNLAKIERNINPIERPENSIYECEGCGS